MKPALALLALLAVPLVAAGGATTDIDATSTGYTPPVAVIASGDLVTWTSIDITHVQRDMTLTASAVACFEVGAGHAETSPAVRFDATASGLVATVDGESRVCSGAIGAGAAGFVLPYFCSIHPTMRGALVITA